MIFKIAVAALDMTILIILGSSISAPSLSFSDQGYCVLGILEGAMDG